MADHHHTQTLGWHAWRNTNSIATPTNFLAHRATGAHRATRKTVWWDHRRPTTEAFHLAGFTAPAMGLRSVWWTIKPDAARIPLPAFFGLLALPHSGWPTILKLTCWVRGTNPSTLEGERARAHQIGEPK
jgi:hypothetical protein